MMQPEYKDGKVIIDQNMARDIKIAMDAYYAGIKQAGFREDACKRFTAEYIEKTFFLESRSKRIPKNEFPAFFNAIKAKTEELLPNL